MASSKAAIVSTPHCVNLLLIILVVAAGTIPHAGVLAADPDPLQDFCIADLQAGLLEINGYPCLAPELVTTDDFWFSGLGVAANLTGNPFNGTATGAFVHSWPALNTLGLGLARLDINPGGVVVPHTHNLATEILFVLEGEMYTGFITNSNNQAVPNKLYAKTVKTGEAFIFPRGLLHFQLNPGSVHAVSVNVLNSQNPGLQLMPIALFGTGVDPAVLTKSFFLSEQQVASLAGIFSKFADASL